MNSFNIGATAKRLVSSVTSRGPVGEYKGGSEKVNPKTLATIRTWYNSKLSESLLKSTQRILKAQTNTVALLTKQGKEVQQYRDLILKEVKDTAKGLLTSSITWHIPHWLRKFVLKGAEVNECKQHLARKLAFYKIKYDLLKGIEGNDASNKEKLESIIGQYAQLGIKNSVGVEKFDEWLRNNLELAKRFGQEMGVDDLNKYL